MVEIPVIVAPRLRLGPWTTSWSMCESRGAVDMASALTRFGCCAIKVLVADASRLRLCALEVDSTRSGARGRVGASAGRLYLSKM